MPGSAAAREQRHGSPAHPGPVGATPETEALHRAVDHCNAAFRYCSTEASEVDDLEDLLCLVDCAEVCATTAALVTRHGQHAMALRGLCLRQCRDAAETCGKYANDEVLATCAQVLRDAVDAMAGALVTST